MSIHLRDRLVDQLDVLKDSERDDFTQLGPCGELPGPDVISPVTKKGGVQVQTDDLGECWMPTTKMRVDQDRNLYLESWLYDQKSTGSR